MYSTLNKRQLLGRLYGNATVYGLGIILVRAGNILLLPLYWLRLEPSDYGVIGLTQAVALFLAPVLGLGLQDAVQRLYYDWRTEDRPYYLAAVWLCVVLVSVLVCGALDLAGSTLFPLLFEQVAFDPYLRIAIWSAFATNLAMIPLALLRVREQLRRYTWIVFGQFLTQTAVTLYLVFPLNMGVTGYLLGMLISAGLWGGYFIVSMAMETKWTLQRTHFTEPLRYAIPIVPAAVLDGLSTIIDRFFLDKFVGLRQIGLYTLAHQFGQGFNVFNQIMKNSWFPFIYRVTSEREDAPHVLAKFSLYYMAVLALPALGIALLSRELILFFGDEKYFGIYNYIPAFVLFYYIHAIAHSFGRGLDLAKRMAYTPVIQVVGLVVSIPLMWLLVPEFGLWGAILAILSANFVRTLFLIYLAHHFYPRPVLTRQVVAMIFVISGVFYLAGLVDTSSLALNVLIKLLTILGGAILLVWFVLDRKPAMALMGNAMRLLMAKIR